mgnify:CR=1 FL=1
MSTASPHDDLSAKSSDPTVQLRRRAGVDALAQTGITPTSSENAALQILALRPEVEPIEQRRQQHHRQTQPHPGADPSDRPGQEPELPPPDRGEDCREDDHDVEAVHPVPLTQNPSPGPPSGPAAIARSAQVPSRATVRNPVWATMRWSGRTAWPSTYQPRCRTSVVAAAKKRDSSRAVRSCITWVTLGV